MQLVKSTIFDRTKTFFFSYKTLLVFLFVYLMIQPQSGWTQDNSPYSRYGIGDLVPPTNVNSRAMGGIAAGVNDPLSINFNNPATYSMFQSKKESNSKKLSWGRAVLDLGVNFDNRTLRQNDIADKFVAKNALFSYLQVGVPIKENLGFSFGLRPVSRISYKINKTELLYDPNTHLPIDSAQTEYSGDGGAYLATLGAGYKIVKNFSIGFNAGYMFGKKDYSTRRALINDTVSYQQSNSETKASFGNLFFNAGFQYYAKLNNNIRLTIGAYGNWQQKLNASEDIIRETFLRDPTQGDIRLDSVSEQKNIKGKIIYPSSYGIGFSLEKPSIGKNRGWQFGMDLVQSNWNNYRYYNETDSVHNTWELRLGGQLMPVMSTTKKSYWNFVSYRAGFFIGPDYIQVQNNKLQRYGISLGVGLPVAFTRQNPNQATIINITTEYSKRGNNSNLLQENLFRVSFGFALSDLWFIKRRYD